MSSNNNTRNIYDTDTVPTSTLSSQNPPSSGIKRVHDTGDYSTGQSLDILGANATEQHGIESRSGIHALDSGADTGRTTYGSSPLNPTSQQQYGQGMTTIQYDPSRVGEEGTTFGSGQQQYGLGQGGTGTGLGHHKVHHEGHLHGHGPSEAAKANCDLCTRDQAAGRTYLSQDTSNLETTTGASRPVTERIAKDHQGVAGGDPSAMTGAIGTYPGDTTGYYGDTGSGTGTNNSYLTDTARHHGGTTTGHHHGVTDTGANPSTMDKIVGGAEKFAGKVTSNTGMYQRGEARAAGDAPTSKN